MKSYEECTQGKHVHEEGANCAPVEGSLAGFRERNKRIPFGERFDAVCYLQDIRACHAAEQVVTSCVERTE